MKTIKTASGIKKIEDQDVNYVPLQLRVILQDHRTHLIDNVISGGLDRYIDYKFNKNVSPLQLSQLKTKLIDLKNSGINMHRYHSILETVLMYDYVQLSNTIFFEEIDQRLKDNLAQTEIFHFERRGVFQL